MNFKLFFICLRVYFYYISCAQPVNVLEKPIYPASPRYEVHVMSEWANVFTELIIVNSIHWEPVGVLMKSFTSHGVTALKSFCSSGYCFPVFHLSPFTWISDISVFLIFVQKVITATLPPSSPVSIAPHWSFSSLTLNEDPDVFQPGSLDLVLVSYINTVYDMQLLNNQTPCLLKIDAKVVKNSWVSS